MLRVAGLSEGDFEAGGAEGGDVDAGGKAVEGEGSAGEAGVVDGAAAKVGDDQIKGRGGVGVEVGGSVGDEEVALKAQPGRRVGVGFHGADAGGVVVGCQAHCGDAAAGCADKEVGHRGGVAVGACPSRDVVGVDAARYGYLTVGGVGVLRIFECDVGEGVVLSTKGGKRFWIFPR